MKHIEALEQARGWVFLVPCPVFYLVEACVTLGVSLNVIPEKTQYCRLFKIPSALLLISVLFSLVGSVWVLCFCLIVDLLLMLIKPSLVLWRCSFVRCESV